MSAPATSPRHRPLVLLIRWGLPLALIAMGVVFILLGHGHVSNVQDQASGSVFTSIPTDRNSMYSAIGVGAIIVALMVVLLGFLVRFNSSDEADRAADEAARDYYARTGRWPGEPGPSRT